ncbi:MAG: alpha-amylase family glycosyl hydrolase [bacterium]|nr:alpha-amylase family glycosyl hydrolase [bacterium]
MNKAKWYEGTVFYEIYVPSFCDGNGDGKGDLKGVISRLAYLKDLGVGGIWLTPFYPSPGADNGYDISNYRKVHPEYGSLEDFDELLCRAHEAGIRVIIDMVLNHTSDRHPWFQESRKAADNSYRDYYLWEREIPNNWESFFDGSAWQYDGEAGAYYYHAFSKEQVCLNWSNGRVRQECRDILRFWLDRGVDGFRLDVINFLKTDRAAFAKDNPLKEGKLLHLYDKNQNGIYGAVRELSELVHSYPDKYLLGEIGEDDPELIRSYVGPGLLDSAFQFNLGSMEKLDAVYMAEQILVMEREDVFPTLFFSSHDMKRHFNRLCGRDTVKAHLLAVFLLTARGIPFLYQGEEIPAEDVKVEEPADLRDVQGRYAYEKKLREGAGEEEAFLYARQRSRDYSRGMIDWRFAQGKEDAPLLSAYRQLTRLRKSCPALESGRYEEVSAADGRLYYRRAGEGRRIGVVLNFQGAEPESSDRAAALYEVRDAAGRLRGQVRYE